jgi:hypothetical protein
MSLTNIFSVDEKGFWFDVLKDERFKYQMDANDTPKEIVLFQDPFPKGDYYYFNPLAEGLGDKSPADQLFQRTIRLNLNENIRIAIIKLLTSLVASKEEGGAKLDHVELRMSSVAIDKKITLIDYADEKLVEEVKKIFDRTGGNFFSVPYIQAQQTAKAMCDVFIDPQWVDKYGVDIRKKSILAFKAAILGVLGIDDEKGFSEFNVKYDPAVKSAARLDTTLRVYYKLYSKFNDILPESCAIDLGTLNDVIERLPMAYAIAKHMVQPTLPRHRPTDLSPSDTSKFAGPVSSSGRRMPSPVVGTPAPDFGAPGRFQPQMVNQGTTPGKFQPQFLPVSPLDPTAPLVNVGGGFGGQPNGGFGHGNRNYFGGGSSFTPAAAGPNFAPGNMFGRPEMQRRYFGN